MRYYINGDGVDFSADISVEKFGDRLLVHGGESNNSALAVRSGDSILVSYLGQQFELKKRAARVGSSSVGGGGELMSPMPGLIVDVFAAEGDVVSKGQKLAVLEAMKTQQPFLAPFDGVVSSVRISKGMQIPDGMTVIVVEPKPEIGQES